MTANRAIAHSVKKSGFTLIELLVALVLMVTALTIVLATFTTTTKAWRRGGALVETLHHGDFVMEQLVSALRSAAYFESDDGRYGFWLERGSGEYPQFQLSWVASGTAFMPMDSDLAKGLHRLVVSIEPDDEGQDSFTVRAFPHLQEVDMDDGDAWTISREVKGLECEIWDDEDESWEDQWEDTNSIPSVVQVSLYLDPLEEFGDPVVLRRLVQIPVAPGISNAVMTVTSKADDTQSGQNSGQQKDSESDNTEGKNE